jgi:hypothetical protein
MSTPAGFVGRQSELRILGERLAAAEMGHPQVVYVEGEAGGGKSTLLSRFLSSLSNAVVLEVAGDEAETLLSYGIIDQLQPGAQTEPGTDPMAVGARLLDLLDRLRADGQVVVLVIDDLQWADRPSSRAMLFALRRLRADKVLAVVSTRAGGLADPGWARFVGGDSRVTRLRLRGLSPGDLTELASALGMGVLSQRGASRLAAHTEGNPLYCRALLDEIGIAGLSAAGEHGLPAPRELSAVILARVAALPATAQSFLSAASVLGQHAPILAIASVARLPDAQNDVDAAVAAGLLTEGRHRSWLSPIRCTGRRSTPISGRRAGGNCTRGLRRSWMAARDWPTGQRRRWVLTRPSPVNSKRPPGPLRPPVTQAPRPGLWSKQLPCHQLQKTGKPGCSTPPWSSSMPRIHLRRPESWHPAKPPALVATL